ncbi:Retrovirus-related Pol polyprotein from transposon RE1 [Vitis vinifera]|uniref:Retrovirus-related Pol polyprotein from transposon RE1 n=1 Tax=Vitis vinifera TaxID=29760 RepID=A0A438I5Q0_VITVI|nr:Retrovirus-related Pol polyprotein from transposon RE1 [Vitis vinifera]
MMGSKEQPAPTLDASALAARSFNSSGGDRQKRDRPWCDYCKKLGHYKETCWKLHGKPADWKPKPRFDRDGRAHMAANSESTSVPEPSPFNKEQMEMLQKLLSQVGNGSTTGVAFTANRGGMKPWIVDTGASDHMTGDAAILQNYKPSNGHSSVHIADGSKSKIAGTGSIKLIKDLYLDSVLHVPNWIDLKSGKMIGSAELCSGLYLLSCGQFSNQVSQASCVQSQSMLESFNSVSNSKPLLIYHSKVFGCTTFVHVYPQNRSKFAPRANKCIFLGYSPTQKGTNAILQPTKRFYTTMDVSFFEHVFFYPKSHVQGESMNEHQFGSLFLRSSQPSTNVPSPVTIQSPMPIQPIAPQLANENLQVYIRRRKRQELEHGSQSTCGQYIDSNSSLPEENIGSQHNTRGIQISEWKKAVQDEIDALEKNGTWTITDLPVGKRPVGCKWIFTIKYKADGSVKRFKARLDSSLIGCQSRLVLATIGHKNAFLNGDLEEEVYMENTTWFRRKYGKESVARSRKGIVVSQRKYILDLLKETGMLGCKPIDTPMDSQKKLGIEKEMSAVSQFMHSPTEEHMEAVYRILRYLKMTPGKGVFFRKTENRDTEVYSDADWAGNIIDRRSTSGYCSFVWGNLVTWRSKKQSVVTRSSAEAEYRALAQGIYEGIWIKRTKHVEIDRHFIIEKVTSETVKLNYVPTKHQTADILTKALSNVSNSVPFYPANFFWKSKVPSKVKAFAWLGAHKKVNTNDMLQLRRPFKTLSPDLVHPL